MNQGRQYKVNHQKRKIAIILRCPDPRLPEAHKGFIHRELHLPSEQYISLKRAGGAISLSRSEELPEDFRSIMAEISLFLQAHSEDICYIIIMSHENCQKYIHEHLAGHEREDLLRAAQILSSVFPTIQIGAYYVKFTNPTKQKVKFETVFETDHTKSLRICKP